MRIQTSLTPLILFTLLLAASSLSQASQYKTLDWVDLLPAGDFEALSNPPASISQLPHDLTLDDMVGSATDAIADSLAPFGGSDPQDEAYYAALNSVNVNQEFDNTDVRIPGFIVPLEFDETQKVTEFFLVPYFGACIHYPPPPPNQIIYIEYPEGISISELYNPFWIEGKMATSLVENTIATSAYSMLAHDIRFYDGP